MEIKKIIPNLRVLSFEKLLVLDQILMSGGNFIQAFLIGYLFNLEILGRISIIASVHLILFSIQQVIIHYPLEVLIPQSKNKTLHGTYKQSIFVRLWIFLFVSFLLTLPFSLITQNLLEGILYQVYVLLLLHHEYTRKCNILERKTLLLIGSDAIISALQFILIYLSNYYFQNPIFIPISLIAAYFTSIILNADKIKLNPSVTGKFLLIHFLLDFSKLKFLFYSTTIQWFNGHIITLILGWFMGVSASGIFRIIQLLYGLLHLLLQSIEGYLPNELSQKVSEISLASNQKIGIHFIQQPLLKWLKPYSILLGLILVSSLIISYFKLLQLDKVFIYAVFVLAPVYGLILLNTFLKINLRIHLQNKTIFKSSVWCAVFSLIALIPFIHFWGIIGVCISMGISQLILFYIYLSKHAIYENNSHTSGQS